MTSEMDLLRLDERQRLAWLMANRGTVLAVGVVWIGMIVWELSQSRAPVFLIAMVPVFALLRLGLYLYYSSVPSEPAERAAGRPVSLYLKTSAAALLLFSSFLPLYSFGSGAGGRQYGWAWGLVVEDWIDAFPIGLAFLWPLLILGATRVCTRPAWMLFIRFLEPLLAAFSCLILLWIPQLQLEFRQVFVILFLPESARAEVGCYLAVVANGLYFVTWLSALLGSRGPAT
jgi:hypothetical protein